MAKLHPRRILSVALILIMASALPLFAQESVDEAALEIIKKQGMENSQVMETASWITDVYGPRLTGSPMLDKATDWAQNYLKGIGMKNVSLHEWGPFGRAWSFSHFDMQVSAPNSFPVIAYPKAWSPGTNGTVTGEVVYLDVQSEDDFAKYRGKLAGKIVLLEDIREVDEWFGPLAQRHDAESLLGLANAPSPSLNQGGFRRGNLANRLPQMKLEFLYEERPAAILDRSSKGDLGTVFVSGARTADGNRAQSQDADVITQATVAVEHYNRIMRMLDKGLTVEITFRLDAELGGTDVMEQNIIAELPGSDLADEVVMLGAHFDSWHAGTGATDNGAGSAVMMEASRILAETYKELGTKPRRTIRLGLWTGEEQGLLGSRAYVSDHVAEVAGFGGGVVKVKDQHEKISGYFNMDNGTGKIRGVYMQGNEAVRPIFQEWLRPFRDMDASTLSISNTGGTDHLAFDAAGVPGFQFIQEPAAYSTRTHHSNMDNLDHLIAADLQQAATIIAAFVYHTAQRDEKLPRKPIVMAEEGTN